MVTQMPDKLKQSMKLSVLLISLSSAIIIIMGIGSMSINYDLTKLNMFLVHAADAQPNFEKNLIIYTEKTRDIITFLLNIRPENKEEYVQFISQIENVGNELKLNLDLESSKNTKLDKEMELEKTLNYNIKFYGSIDDLSVFLRKIEALPYFIRIDNIKFSNPKYLSDKEKTTPNVSIKLKLYVK